LPRLKRAQPSILEIPLGRPGHGDPRAVLPDAAPGVRPHGLRGLRPNEVRAIPWRDMKLRWEGGVPVGGFLSVRAGLSFGEKHTPKTGMREVPIARPLAVLLGEVAEGAEGGAHRDHGRWQPWGQYGLDRAFERVRDRAGLSGWSVCSLRHYAITSWLRKGPRSTSSRNGWPPEPVHDPALRSLPQGRP
jgi:hypothetical protein